jgi:hypothetical protein
MFNLEITDILTKLRKIMLREYFEIIIRLWMARTLEETSYAFRITNRGSLDYCYIATFKNIFFTFILETRQRHAVWCGIYLLHLHSVIENLAQALTFARNN